MNLLTFIITVIVGIILGNVIWGLYHGTYTFKELIRQTFCIHKYDLAAHNEYWKNKIYECEKCKKLKDVWY